VLKDWLDRAFMMAIADPDGRPCLTREIIKATALPNRQISRLIQEAKAGELKLIQMEDSELAKEFGLPYTPSMSIPAPVIDIPMPASKVKKKMGRAGLRGPSRDPVGGAHV
jgi:hypothetical protein